MNLKTPNAAIERGGYTAIVRKEGDLAIAENFEGKKIKESVNAAGVIQAAIDSCNKMGRVVLNDLFDITSEITLPSLGWTSYASGITLQGSGNGTGLNYTPSTGYALKLIGDAGAVQCSHHLIDNFLIKAPNTTDGGIGILGGCRDLNLNNIRVFNCPNGKGVYITGHETMGNNLVRIANFEIYNCEYGIYALWGPSLFLNDRGYIKTLSANNGKEALYYSVTGYTGNGFKQLHTENLEILSEAAAQRALYIKGDRYLITNHNNLWDDATRPI